MSAARPEKSPSNTSGHSYTRTKPLMIIPRNEKGNSTCQQKDMSWSMRRGGREPRSHMNVSSMAEVLTKISTSWRGQPTSLPRGQFQPPRNTRDASTESMKTLTYSAKKNMLQRMPLYSMNGPPTISDSAVGMSKGVG